MVRHFVSRSVFALTFFCLTCFFSMASAETIFEGYYKITLGQKHVGYAVQRYEFLPKKNQFKSTYFIHTNELLDGAQESLVAISSDKFTPISYQYTSKVKENFKTIDARFEKNMMSAKVSDGKNVNNVSKQIPEGTFMSTFLVYMMLQKGFQLDRKYAYQAIAEEDASLQSGVAFIKEETKYKGKSVYRALYNFKGAKAVFILSKKGEVLYTNSPMQRVSTELVKQPSEATAGLQLPQKTLNILFGGVPTGRKNAFYPVGGSANAGVAAKANGAANTKAKSASPKKEASKSNKAQPSKKKGQ